MDDEIRHDFYMHPIDMNIYAILWLTRDDEIISEIVMNKNDMHNVHSIARLLHTNFITHLFSILVKLLRILVISHINSKS